MPPNLPADLVALQRALWLAQARTYRWLLAGPSTAAVTWPLPRQREYVRLLAAQDRARRAVEEHPVVAGAIADGRWAVTARALRDAAREGEDDEAQAAAWPVGPSGGRRRLGLPMQEQGVSHADRRGVVVRERAFVEAVTAVRTETEHLRLLVR